MGELTSSGRVVWAVSIMEGVERRTAGAIGPFSSAADANAYATERNYPDWIVVPLVWLSDAENLETL
ncbi:conserved hypothetical protein [Frankia canadensis]|uniref:YCII-related domain-containing protein n=1 Tax=Frankia canadensis TaxID=1836972 RepID=A0A2I2KUJ8_9ACTN|nr:hypothetical protein [Frankia canadensis]SNQ49334.1 conserved hypothetical protein [Frankia canadensis]SOU56624.1 conserved hypothetical protein [Frankia canadensis]